MNCTYLVLYKGLLLTINTTGQLLCIPIGGGKYNSVSCPRTQQQKEWYLNHQPFGFCTTCSTNWATAIYCVSMCFFCQNDHPVNWHTSGVGAVTTGESLADCACRNGWMDDGWMIMDGRMDDKHRCLHQHYVSVTAFSKINTFLTSIDSHFGLLCFN